MFSLILFCIIMCSMDYIKNKKIFTTMFIFNFVWASILFLYELKISELQHDLSSRTVFILWCCVLPYNIATILSSMGKINRIGLNKEIDFKIDNNIIKRRIKIAKKIAWILFFIEVIYSKGVPLLWKITGYGKNYFDFGIPSLNGALMRFNDIFGNI